ncbi:hypothetical protein QAD02_011613 [Eretmocerus hayati]|uniref:Uncharacterized protein n=1 Tax=Eretmocerus hayati TaxID=131215 RepID=A0ACC2NXI3_9HYME|nr:hypothetical protein QAD02_011613 [Eretmocerus hayati]
MGIPGLTSYINNNSNVLLLNYQLHNCYLVVDGNSLVSQLYSWNKCDYCFSGGYAQYLFYVSEFFDNLLKCRVSPIVILDGGMEDRKMITIYSRLKEKIASAANSTPSNQQQILPILAKEIFKLVAQEKKIQLIQTPFEADDHVAAVARILNCPVLSYDSDFFIYDVDYIPFNTMSSNISIGNFGQNHIQCKIFRSDHWREFFPMMNKKSLPLIAVLLGNDYIDPIIFQNFFETLRIPSELKQKLSHNRLHLKIEAILYWLQKYSIEHAVGLILKKISAKKRQPVLKIIEMIVNGYVNSPSTLENIIEFLPQEIVELKQKMAVKSYTFKDINLDAIHEPETLSRGETYLGPDKNFKSSLSANESNMILPVTEITCIEIIPDWFKHKYSIAQYPANFMDMIHRQLVVVRERMEDVSHPTTINICLKIIKVIFMILSNGTTNCNHLKYVTRGKNLDVATCELECAHWDFPFEAPTLQELKHLEFSKKKAILFTTLGVLEQELIRFPPPWRLYVACIKFWLCEADRIFVTKCHLYALVFSLLAHVVKRFNHFKSYLPATRTAFHSNARNENRQPYYGISMDMTVKDALENLNEADCSMAGSYFQSRNSINHRNFNITVIHAFTLFQSCVRSSMDLNALLDYPCYVNIDLAEFFSGFLINNLYHEFRLQRDLNEYVKNIFKNSLSVLQLFVTVLTNIQAMVKL